MSSARCFSAALEGATTHPKSLEYGPQGPALPISANYAPSEPVLASVASGPVRAAPPKLSHIACTQSGSSCAVPQKTPMVVNGVPAAPCLPPGVLAASCSPLSHRLLFPLLLFHWLLPHLLEFCCRRFTASCLPTDSLLILCRSSPGRCLTPQSPPG